MAYAVLLFMGERMPRTSNFDAMSCKRRNGNLELRLCEQLAERRWRPGPSRKHNALAVVYCRRLTGLIVFHRDSSHSSTCSCDKPRRPCRHVQLHPLLPTFIHQKLTELRRLDLRTPILTADCLQRSTLLLCNPRWGTILT